MQYISFFDVCTSQTSHSLWLTSDDGEIWIIKYFYNYCSNITVKIQFYSHGIVVVYLPCRVVCGWNKFPSYHHLLWKECLEGVLVEIGWFVWNVLKMAILRHNPPIPMSSQLRVPFPELHFIRGRIIGGVLISWTYTVFRDMNSVCAFQSIHTFLFHQFNK